MRLEGYLRVSRVNGRAGDSYISLPVQRESIAAYAQEIGGTIVEWHTDEDFSGGTTDRPAFEAALTRIYADESDGLVVMKIDRFARSVADGTTTVRDLINAGKTFASVHERIDPTTPEGKYMLTSFLAQGELFLDQIKASWKVAKKRAVDRGVLIGPTPFGYLRVKAIPSDLRHISPVQAADLIGTEVPVGVLLPDPDTSHLVTEAFRRGAGGTPVGEIAAWLESEHPKDAKRGWTATAVRRMLAARVYLGEVTYGDMRRTQAHMPLTDPRTFDNAQPAPRRARRKGAKRPFSGLLVCGNCDGPMVGNSFGGRGETPVYRCGNQCGNGSVITAAKIDPFIYGLARDGLRQALAGRTAAGVAGELAALDSEIREAEAELDSYVTNLTIRRTLGPERWEAGLTARAGHVEDLKRQRTAAVNADRLAEIDLGNPSEHDLRRFALTSIDRVIVRRGRGSVSERCEVVFRDDHDGDA